MSSELHNNQESVTSHLKKVHKYYSELVPKETVYTDNSFNDGYLKINTKIFKIEKGKIDFEGSIVINDFEKDDYVIYEYYQDLPILENINVSYKSIDYKKISDLTSLVESASEIYYPNKNLGNDIVFEDTTYGKFVKEVTKINFIKTMNIVENNEIVFVHNLSINVRIDTKVNYYNYYEIFAALITQKYFKLGDKIKCNDCDITITDIHHHKKNTSTALFEVNEDIVISCDNVYLWKNKLATRRVTVEVLSSDTRFLDINEVKNIVVDRLSNSNFKPNDIMDFYSPKFKVKISSVDNSANNAIYYTKRDTILVLNENAKIYFVNDLKSYTVKKVTFNVDKNYLVDSLSTDDVFDKLLKAAKDYNINEEIVTYDLCYKNSGLYPYMKNSVLYPIYIKNLKFIVKDIEFDLEDGQGHTQLPDDNGEYIIKFTSKTVFDYVYLKEDVSVIRKSEEVSNPRITVDVIKNLKDKISSLGLAGMDEIIDKIIKDVLISRTDLIPVSVKKFIKPNRGILFYGPPGTGKTTLARDLAQVLDIPSKNIKMLTATEIFNKWLGESEKAVRDLFEPAKKEYQLKKDKSSLHLIIIDEIDAILTQRGKHGDSSTRESIVNQFLGEMDGLTQCDNFLIIGLTNRLDIIDKAALRSGRFGCQINVDKPTMKQRKLIFESYLKKLNDEFIFDELDTEKLSKITEGFVGADIEHLFNNCIDKYLMGKLMGTESRISTNYFEELIDKFKEDRFIDLPFTIARVLY